jgi:cation transport regulator
MSIYPDLSALPDEVKNSLPLHARVIFMNAYNSAWEGYKSAENDQAGGSREEAANRMAWAAVMKVYEKEGQSGKWKRKMISIPS